MGIETAQHLRNHRCASGCDPAPDQGVGIETQRSAVPEHIDQKEVILPPIRGWELRPESLIGHIVFLNMGDPAPDQGVGIETNPESRH